MGSRARVLAFALLASSAPPAGTGCRTLEPGASRPPRPLAASLRDALRPRHPGIDLRFELQEETDTYRRFVFRFETFCEHRGDFRAVRGDYYQTRAAAPGSPAPLVVLSPILAGPVDDYRASRYFAARAAAAGYSAFFLHQETVILDGERDAFDLEARLRESVRDTVAALDLFAARDEVDPSRLGSLGISLGALRNLPLIASEPRLVANVLCLTGSGLGRILLASDEELVEEYLESRRRRDGLEAEAVAEEVARWVRSAPEAVAESIAGERVLLFLARWDAVVPYRFGLDLREKLGKPETHVVPLGHYSSLIVAPWVAGCALAWMAERFAAAASSESGPRASGAGGA